MATGDILAVRIGYNTDAGGASMNGAFAEIDIDNLAAGGTYDFGLGTNNDPSSAKVSFSVRSDGYDATGAATHLTHTIYGVPDRNLGGLRKPYPNQASVDESVSGSTLTVRVALSDFVYSADDQITCTIASGFYTKTGTPNNGCAGLSVTNNSTLTHPKCVGRWAWPGWERITSADFLVEFVAFHRSARNKKPLACCKITATDAHSHSVTKTITDMTVSTRTGDRNSVLVYAATFTSADFTGASFTAKDVVTFRAQCYPWIGDSGSVLDTDTGADGIAQPDERMGPLLALYDGAGTYGEAYAVVDPTNGQNSSATTWVYASQAAAEAAYAGDNTKSYKYVGRAAEALKAYNNANYGRNEPGAAVALLVEGNHALPGYGAADSGAMDTWLTVTRLSSASKANVVVNSGTNGSIGVRRVKYSGLTFSNGSLGCVRGNTTTQVLWLHDCALNLTGDAPLYQWKLGHVTMCSLTAVSGGFTAYGGSKAAFALIRGNVASSASATGGIGCQVYCVLGNKNVLPYIWEETGNSDSAQVSDNSVVAFNSFYNLNASNPFYSGPIATANAIGIAVVQNCLERVTAGGAATLSIAADNAGSDVKNAIVWHNTNVGERTNLGYNDNGSTARLRQNWSIIGNLFDNFNNKDDTFTTANAARTGAWPVGYHVGAYGNFARSSVDNEWAGEFGGLYSISGQYAGTGTLGFTHNYANNYQSGGGSGAGNGDYTLTGSSSACGLIPAGLAVLPFDLAGNARRNAGSGAAGAYEYGSDPSFRAALVARRRRVIGTGVI